MSARPARPPATRAAQVASSWSGVAEIAILAVALAARLTHFWLMRDEPIFGVLICDAWQYDHWAREIAGGQWLGAEVYYQTPLYPYLLGVIYGLVGHQVWAARLVQAVCGALACVALTRAGTHFFSRRAGLVAGGLLAIYPPAIFFDGILQKATLDLLLVSLLLWLLGKAQAAPGRYDALAAGLTLGAFVLNRENALVLVPVVLGWFAWLARGMPRHVARTVAVCLLGMAAVLAPVAIRNWYVGGELVLTTSQLGPNFYIGNNRAANGRYRSLRAFRGDPRYERHDARILAEEALGRSLSPREVSAFWLDRATSEIRAEPARWLRLLGHKALLTVHRSEVVDGESPAFHARASWVLSVPGLALHFGVLAPLAVMGAFLTRREWRRLWVLYAMFLAFAAAVALFYVFARYRFPLVPMAMLFAGAAVIAAWDAIRGRSPAARRSLAAAALVALPVAVAANWPLREGDETVDEVTTLVNIGTAYLDLNRPAEALTPLRHAAQLDPKFPGTLHNLGLAEAALGDDAAAEAWWLRAVALDGTLAVSHLKLAELYDKRGSREQADEHLATALRVDPLLAEAHQLAGRLAMARGDCAAGLAAYNRAAELAPASARIRADIGMALVQCGRAGEGVEQLRAALKLEPDQLLVANNLAWILATSPEASVRRPAEALEHARRVCAAAGQEVPSFLDTLAAAQAASGDFEGAAKTIARAIELSTGQAPADEIDALRRRQALYQRGAPYVEAPPSGA